LHGRTNSKLAIIEFTIIEISDILKSLNKKKASGHDLIRDRPFNLKGGRGMVFVSFRNGSKSK
jgi:hypothetical protein